MKRRHYTIPKDNEGIIFEPALQKYNQLIEANQKLRHSVSMFDAPLVDLVKEARVPLLKLANEYTKSTHQSGKYAISQVQNSPILGTGHQPIMFHPGICIKNFVMAKVAKDTGAIPILFTVDSAEFAAETVPLPVANSDLSRFDYYLFPQRSRVTYESAEVEPADILWDRLKTIERFFFSNGLEEIDKNYKDFLGRLSNHELDASTFAKRVSIMRRAWEESAEIEYLEVPISMLCRSGIFIQFFFDAVFRAKNLAEIYNSELVDYREKNKIRYPSNPVPDLEIKPNKIELPFWIIFDKKRYKPYATEDGKVLIEDMGKISLSSLEIGMYSIRPRAITLSIYLRLFLSDFFIHGVGGANYDIITDMIVKRFYGFDAPVYGCVSATVFLDIDMEDPTNEIKLTNNILRKLEQHPEKSGLGGVEMDKMTSEKKRLILEIESENANKKLLGSKIAEINKKMVALLEPERLRVETEIGRLMRRGDDWKVVAARDYPYFLYSPEQILRLI
ncbi:MAG TPA: hypothetical protein QF720_04770 [Nitrospinota bacterium]|nr:hypothetical protein [Nitrospinota bacterium]